MNDCSINVHVSDVVDEGQLQGMDESSVVEAIYLLQVAIERTIGGMLCIDHFHLPESRSGYRNGEWIIRIRCCCEEQLQSVRTRLDEFFETRGI